MPETRPLDANGIRRVTEEVITAITMPTFIQAIQALRETPLQDRLTEGARRLSSDRLRAEGVPLPTGMRITSRYFEAGQPSIELVEDPDGRRSVSMGPARAGEMGLAGEPVGGEELRDLGGCACAGLGGACVGAGWS